MLDLQFKFVYMYMYVSVLLFSVSLLNFIITFNLFGNIQLWPPDLIYWSKRKRWNNFHEKKLIQLKKNSMEKNEIHSVFFFSR